MHVHINHCWCSDSNWGGVYDGRVMVVIERVPRGKTFYDKPSEDWTNLLDKPEVDLVEDREGFRQHYRPTLRLKPEILEWLEKNVKDRNRKPWGDRTELALKKGWAVGTDLYNSKDPLSFTIFFNSVREALKFVAHWSVHKKPTTYLNYFRDIRRELNPKTGRLSRVEDFTPRR